MRLSDRQNPARQIVLANTQLYQGKLDQEFVREAQALYTLEMANLMVEECLHATHVMPAVVLGLDTNSNVTEKTFKTLMLAREPTKCESLSATQVQESYFRLLKLRLLSKI